MELNEYQKKTETTPIPNVELDPIRLQRYMLEKKDNQNLLFAVIGGAIATLVGGGLWAVITVFTDHQIGWMAIGIGVLVGFTVRLCGKGFDQIYGIIGAVLSLLGCLIGNILTIIIVLSTNQNIPILQLLMSLDIKVTTEIMINTFQLMDVLFYGIAIYEGYRFSFNTIPDEDYAKLAKE